MKSAIQSFLQLAKRVERSAVSWAHAVTAMRGVGFFVVTAYALRKLPPSDMGLWYLMLSATGLAQNVELGFGNTIGRFCSYFNTGADRVPKLGLPEPPKSSQPSFAHLAGAAASARRLYPPLGLATMLAIVGIMGIWYMGGRINTALDIHHLVAFAILAVGSGINMSYHYWLGMLYGINRVRLYNQLLVIGFVINYSVAFLGIYAGMGLLALAVGQVLFNAVPRLAARYHMRRYIPRESFAAPARIPVSDLWPVTWRAGVTNLASGIYIQGMTVFCAIVTDLETTASFGLCLQLALTLHIFSSNWLSVKCPEINVLRASGRIGTASRLIVRRIIATSGNGKNLVNDCPATLHALKQIGDLLVDLHGPHDHQSLLSQEFQLDLLDSFGHSWKQRAAYEDVYRALVELRSRGRDLEGDDEAVAQQIDFLKYQVKEIEQADLDDADEDELDREHTTAANATRILELSGAARETLTDGESPAFDALAFAQKQLTELAGIFDEATEWRGEAESIAVQIQELSNTINGAVQNIEADPQRLQWIEDRKALLHKLKRKYGGALDDIRGFAEQARQQLEDLESRGEKIRQIEGEIDRIQVELTQVGDRLSAARRKAAKSLGAAITVQLRDLGFAHGAFDVMLGPAEPGPAGRDEVEFGFAPNVGEPMRPLRAIASSGEISRVMLAVKAVLAEHDRIPVLVFDEIDTNVGGEMGNAIGDKMATVAANHQVLCITHLPQVAVHGKHHFVVAKAVAGGRTRTEITPLSATAKVEEIARMLGGRDSTSVALRHAKEMLDAHASG